MANPLAVASAIPFAPQSSSTAGQPKLGATILAAALVLPGIQAAQAETAPERGQISLKYLNYEDSQTGLDRITVHSPSIMVMTPVAGVWSVEGTLVSDDVSGASPRYHSAVSGASRMDDRRTAGDLRVTRYLPRGTVTVGAAYSSENDYQSRALSVQASVASEDKNTTWNFGIGGADDRIDPVNHVVSNEKKKTVDLMLGVTQVLGMQDIAQFNLTHARGRGYFSDPYKLLDLRPRERNQTALVARWNHHFSGTDGTSRLAYRYYRDTYGVSAHTLTGEYVQPLAQGWAITPSLRLYSQRAASFYVDPVYDSNIGAPFPPGYVFGSNQNISQDQRLAAFGAVTVGIKVAKQLTKDWLLDVKLERYEQRGSWRAFGEGSPGLDPLRAHSLQIGVTRQW